MFNFQFIGWENDLLKLKYAEGIISRAEGFLGHANNLAFFLILWLPLLFLRTTISSPLKIRILYLSVFSAGALALILTFSRGGWLAFVFSFALILTIFFKEKVRSTLPHIGKIISSLALIAIVLTAPFYNKIYERLTRDTHGAAYARIPLAESALRVIEYKPFTGVGLGNYQFMAPRLWYLREAAPVHNIYLHMAAELGIPASVFFFWLLIAFLQQGIAALKTQDRWIFLFSLGLTIGLLAVSFHGIFELGTIGSQKLLPISFVGGLLVAINQCRKQIDSEKLPHRRDAV